MSTDWKSRRIVIGGVVGTVAEHVSLMRDEGQSDRCIDYFIGHAIGKALDGDPQGTVSIEDYRRRFCSNPTDIDKGVTS